MHWSSLVFIKFLVILVACEAKFIEKRQSRACGLRTCNQVITGRYLHYGRALEVIQNEEYLNAADLSLAHQSRLRAKRSTFSFPNGTLSWIQLNTNFTVDAENIIKAGLIGGLLVALSQFSPRFGAAGGLPALAERALAVPQGYDLIPLDQPQPGEFGGGRSPKVADDLNAKIALSLVPKGLTPVAIFPAFNRPRSLPAVGVIFKESTTVKKSWTEKIMGTIFGYNLQERSNEDTEQPLYGFKVYLTLVENQPCVMGSTCEVGSSNQGIINLQEFRSEAQPECRANVDPVNQCLTYL